MAAFTNSKKQAKNSVDHNKNSEVLIPISTNSPI